MPIAKTIFACSNCDAQFPKWSGRCTSCGQWNTLSQESATASSSISVKPLEVKPLSDVTIASVQRFSSGNQEVDNLLGASGQAQGFVAGSLVLLGGDPGIGKSTLALQVAVSAAKAGRKTLYVSGEESLTQIKMRAERISSDFAGLEALSDTSLEQVLATVKKVRPELLILDSIQTLYSDTVSGVAGGMAQVSHATARILELVKPQNTATLIIGHVTKEGNLAGPRTLEHMVDAVFYLEGERFAQLRILRCVKNRFGSTNQVAVFEMKGNGLFTVENPSALFLTEQNKNRAGTAVACTVEGSRALLLEIQALVAHSEYNYPKRNATGFDQNRLQLIIAVLERNLGLKLSDKDIYVAVAGGFRINEPACDLAVAAAIISSLKNVAVGDQVFVGEIGLSGEVRQVGNIEKRLQEAEKLGFKKINTPQGGSGVNKVAELRDLVKLFA